MSIIIHNCWWYDVLKIIANCWFETVPFFLFQSAEAPYLYVESYFACLFVCLYVFCF